MPKRVIGAMLWPRLFRNELAIELSMLNAIFFLRCISVRLIIYYLIVFQAFVLLNKFFSILFHKIELFYVICVIKYFLFK